MLIESPREKTKPVFVDAFICKESTIYKKENKKSCNSQIITSVHGVRHKGGENSIQHLNIYKLNIN